MTKEEATQILIERLQFRQILLKQENKNLPKLQQRFLKMYYNNIRDKNYEWTLKALVKQEAQLKAASKTN